MPAVDDFLKTVLRSGLLDREQLQQVLRGLPRAQRGDPEAVADHLVKHGKLSRFQSRKLLQGAALGLVLGPFQVLAPIGKGGMGTVYLARDQRSGQLLALKILPPKKAREAPRLLARFRREMEMCQRVAHPHIAWTCDVGLWQGVYYIAMEYIPGRSLYRVVAQDGPLQAPRAARLFAEIASALDHAHTQGLIHRDLKPSNVLITPNDHAKLLDLGLALMQGESGGDREVIGGQGYVIGTMDYIAPEQAEDPSKVDPRSDLYSLGCTLYYALTGRQPFPGGTVAEKLHRHRTEEPSPVPEFNPDVPPLFIGLLRRLMAKKPAQRPASAAEVRDELLHWAAGETSQPMDRPEDSGYRAAVAVLETAEPSTDASGEVLSPASGDTPPPAEPQGTAPVVQKRTPAPKPRRAAVLLPGKLAGAPAPRPSSGMLPWLLAAGVAALGLLGLAVAGALYWLPRH
jgi:serine/threonine protein kinase